MMPGVHVCKCRETVERGHGGVRGMCAITGALWEEGMERVPVCAQGGE